MQLRIGALALALALVAGCGPPAAPAAIPFCQPPVCAVEPLVYAVEVVPPRNLDPQLLPIEVASIDPSSGLFTVQLPQPIVFNGTVRVGAGRTPLESTIQVTRPSRILGQPDVAYSTGFNLTMDGRYSYSMSVTPSTAEERYSLRVIATGTPVDYPPQVYAVPATANPTTFDLPLSDVTTLIQVNGHVTDALLAGLPSVTVQALDVTTRRTVSTTAVTQSDGGYTIRLSPQITGTSVILQATPPATNLPVLEETLDVSHPGVGKSVSADLAMPPVPNALPFSYSVVGLSASGSTDAIPNAVCTFTANVSNPLTPNITATFTASALTDSTGHVVLSVIPSTTTPRSYDVTITPPSGSPFQTTLESQYPVGITPFGVSVFPPLALRAKVSGRVLDPNGLPLAGVVVMTAADDVQQTRDAAAPDAPGELPMVVSGDQGRFALSIDSPPSSYDVGLVPPESSGAGRLWLLAEAVPTTRDLGDLTVPIGTTVYARVLDPGGLPLANAEVRVYSVSPKNAACDPNDPSYLRCLSPPRLVADAPTDDFGNAALLFPGVAPIRSTAN